MNIVVNVHKDIKLNELKVFASLPDMGMVGGIASEHLVGELETEKIAEIKIFEKPWVKCNNGLIKSIPEVYEIFVNYNEKIVIMHGKNQPQDPINLYNLVNSFLNLIQSIGNPKIIYTAGGYFQPKLVESPKAYGASNSEKLNQRLIKSGINILNDEIENITWFNGVIIGMATERKIDSIGLFGEISNVDERQPLAAKAIIKAFSSLENIFINTEKFDRDYESEILKRSTRNNNEKDNKKFGPGIG